METAKKIHESIKKGEKNYDCSICWNDWDILWMDDYHMTLYNMINENQKISFIRSMEKQIL